MYTSTKTGRLSGRLREQARSHKVCGGHHTPRPQKRRPEGRLFALLPELPPQPTRHAVDIGVFPRPVRTDRPAPAVVPAVVGALAVEGVGLVIQHVDAQASDPNGCCPPAAARSWQRCVAAVWRVWPGCSACSAPATVDGVGLGCDGGIGGGVGCSGGRWTAQALNPKTRLSRVIRAMAVMVAFPVICPGCRWSVFAARWCCWPGAGCDRSIRRRSVGRRGRCAQPVGLQGSSTVSTAASLRRHRPVRRSPAGRPRSGAWPPAAPVGRRWRGRR